MTTLIQEYQIQSYRWAWGKLTNVALGSNSASIAVTASLATLLSTATRDGTALANQEAVLTPGSEKEGVVANGAYNKCGIFVAGEHVKDDLGNDIYARITRSGAAWTVTFYTFVDTTETPYTFANATTIDVLIPLFFPWQSFPYTSDSIFADYVISADSSKGGGVTIESLTVTADNTLPNLTKGTPQSFVTLVVNSAMYTDKDTNPVFSYAGKVLTWTASNGFKLVAGSNVIALYQ